MQLENWTQSLVSAMGALWSKIAGLIPALLGAIIVVVLGFLVARLLDTLLSKLLAKIGLDRLIQGTGLNKMLARVGIKAPVSKVIGKIVYWFILLVFMVSALESLGLERVSATLDILALYVPKVFAAAIVLLAGILLAQLLNNVVSGAAEGVGLEYAGALGRISQGLVIIITISVAISQLDIKTELLNYVIAIVLFSIGLAVAIAVGFGSKGIIRQVVAGIYVRELYELGQHISFGDVEGTIEEIGTVKTIIQNAEGELVYVPNTALLEQQVKSS